MCCWGVHGAEGIRGVGVMSGMWWVALSVLPALLLRVRAVLVGGDLGCREVRDDATVAASKKTLEALCNRKGEIGSK